MSAHQEDARVSKQPRPETERAIAIVPAMPDLDRSQRSPVGPFVVGTLIGGVAGTIVGTALSPYTRGLVIGLYQLVSRRLSSSERDQLRFELLLQ